MEKKRERTVFPRLGCTLESPGALSRPTAILALSLETDWSGWVPGSVLSSLAAFNMHGVGGGGQSICQR